MIPPEMIITYPQPIYKYPFRVLTNGEPSSIITIEARSIIPKITTTDIFKIVARGGD